MVQVHYYEYQLGSYAMILWQSNDKKINVGVICFYTITQACLYCFPPSTPFLLSY